MPIQKGLSYSSRMMMTIKGVCAFRKNLRKEICGQRHRMMTLIRLLAVLLKLRMTDFVSKIGRASCRERV